YTIDTENSITAFATKQEAGERIWKAIQSLEGGSPAEATAQGATGGPFSADRRLPIFELLDGRQARNAVPNLDQPPGNQAGQFLLAAEALTLEKCPTGGRGAKALATILPASPRV